MNSVESATVRWKKIRAANNTFSKIFKDKDKCFLIHYSCESFNENDHGSLKVTSIAIRNLESAQTNSYSIFQYAEKIGIPKEQINERYPEIEQVMLQEYFNFLKENAHKTFIHWNMRDINYGFQAIEHRGAVLRCDIFKLPDSSKVDLSRLLIQKFSGSYIDHPRLEKLMDLNNITKLHFLTGKQEAECLKNGEYLKLHQSTLRKVDTFENIIERVEDKNLKISAHFFEVYGLSMESIWLSIKKHWFYTLVVMTASIIGLIIKFKHIFENL